jgi:hypothetical protein
MFTFSNGKTSANMQTLTTGMQTHPHPLPSLPFGSSGGLARTSAGANMRTQCPCIVDMYRMTRMRKTLEYKFREGLSFITRDDAGYVIPDTCAHVILHNFFHAYLAHHMPEVIQWPHMAQQLLQQERLELMCAFSGRAPVEAAAPRALSFWLLVRHIPKPYQRAYHEFFVKHVIHGFVHLMASNVGHSSISTHIRSVIVAGPDAEQVAIQHNALDAYNNFQNDESYHVCALVSWMDENGTQRSCVETLDNKRYVMPGLADLTTTVSAQMFSDGRHPIVYTNPAEWLREVFIRMCAGIEDTNPALRTTVSKLLLPINEQPPNALMSHLNRISYQFMERIRPSPSINRDQINLRRDLLAQGTTTFVPTGHMFNMMPSTRLNHLFSTHSIPTHHDGAAQFRSFATSTLINESVPMFGVCLSNQLEAGKRFFDCEDSWFLPATDEFPLDQQAAAPHLCGVMTQVVSFEQTVTAYASFPTKDSPQTSKITVVYPVFIPVGRQTLSEWFAVPCPPDTFVPLDRRFNRYYDNLMDTINTFMKNVSTDPLGFQPAGSNTAIETFAANHIHSVDNTFIELGLISNDIVHTIGSASNHFNAERGEDAINAARFFSVLCRKYGPNMTVDYAIQKLCEELEEWQSYGMNMEEVRQLRLIKHAIT